MARTRTKLIRSLLKTIGYDLRRIQRVNVSSQESGAFFDREPGFEGFDATLARPVTHFDIYLRTCARVEVFGGEHRRFVGVPKSEVIVRCMRSLLNSVRFAQESGVKTEFSLTIVDDHSDPPCLDALRAVLEHSSFPAQIVSLETYGNGPSLAATYELARKNAKDLIYFAEDDYLYDRCAVLEAVRSYERLAGTLDRDVVLTLADFPDRYRRIDPAYVLLGQSRHWRSVKSTTGTIVVSLEILRKYWENFQGLTRYGVDEGVTEGNTIDLIYADTPCFSPLPSLALHLEVRDALSPYVDWQNWWEATRGTD